MSYGFARANLALEMGAGCLFLLCVGLSSLIVLISFTFLGLETTSIVEPETELEKRIFVPRSYLVTYLLLLIPIIVMSLAILGMRVLLVDPEPAPWFVPELQGRDRAHGSG